MYLVCGRCGRAGRPGIVINLANPETKFVVGKFSNQLGLPFDDCEVKGGRFWAVTRTDPSASAVDASAAAAVALKDRRATSGTEGISRAESMDAEGEVEAMVMEEGGVGDTPSTRRRIPVDRAFLGDAEASSLRADAAAGGVGGVDDDEADFVVLEDHDVSAEDTSERLPDSIDNAVDDDDLEAFETGDGGYVSAPDAEEAREDTSPGEVKLFKVPGGIGILHPSTPDEEEGDGGFDMDDWGDGDWGEEDEEGDWEEGDWEDDDEEGEEEEEDVEEGA